MIGQHLLKSQICEIIESGFPRFVIITGPTGGGKKLIANYISSKLGYPLCECGTKIEDIRAVITASYKVRFPTLYAIYNTDSMSTSAKNAMLKIVEEPPFNAHFILTATNQEKILETIRSRGVMFSLQPYSKSEFKEYLESINSRVTEEELNILVKVCQTPGQVETVLKYGVTDFYQYGVQVAENVGYVSQANALKIGKKLAVKEEGWDIELFIRCVESACLGKLLTTNDVRYSQAVKVCSKFKSELYVSGINKQMLVDLWILQLSEVLYGAA